jgi:hypothetical protein
MTNNNYDLVNNLIKAANLIARTSTHGIANHVILSSEYVQLYENQEKKIRRKETIKDLLNN